MLLSVHAAIRGCCYHRMIVCVVQLEQAMASADDRVAFVARLAVTALLCSKGFDTIPLEDDAYQMFRQHYIDVEMDIEDHMCRYDNGATQVHDATCLDGHRAQ